MPLSPRHHTPTRRRFLTTATAATTLLLPPHHATAAATQSQTETDPRVPELVRSTLGIDTHNHIDVPLTAADSPGPDLDLAPELQRSGLSALCITFATDYQPGDAYDRFLHGFAALDRQLERNHLQRSLTAADLRAAHSRHQPTVVQSVEGGHFLAGRIERVAEAYGRGLRHLGLLHDSDATVPLGDVYTNPPRYGGLSPFGADVIKECNRLGILVDLAHASLPTTEAALKIATKPVIISHTGLDTELGANPNMARMMRPRLISKQHAKLVASAGGLIGVWTHLADTPLDYAHNIRALVDIIGVDHVCLGTDTKLAPPPGSQHAPRPGERTNQAWPNQTTGFYYAVVAALLKTGFTPADIAQIGGANFLRVFSAAVHA